MGDCPGPRKETQPDGMSHRGGGGVTPPPPLLGRGFTFFLVKGQKW